MFEVNFFPIYGAMIGVNYWNENLSEHKNENPNTQHLIQIMFLLFGISIVWYEPKDNGI
jgi:hypothetical protein